MSNRLQSRSKYLVDLENGRMISAVSIPGVDEFVKFVNDQNEGSPRLAILELTEGIWSTITDDWERFLAKHQDIALRYLIERHLGGHVTIRLSASGSTFRIEGYTTMLAGLLDEAPRGVTAIQIQDALNRYIAEKFGGDILFRLEYATTHRYDSSTGNMVLRDDIGRDQHPYVKFYQTYPSMKKLALLTNSGLREIAHTFDIWVANWYTKRDILGALTAAHGRGRQLLEGEGEPERAEPEEAEPKRRLTKSLAKKTADKPASSTLVPRSHSDWAQE